MPPWGRRARSPRRPTRSVPVRDRRKRLPRVAPVALGLSIPSDTPLLRAAPSRWEPRTSCSALSSSVGRRLGPSSRGYLARAGAARSGRRNTYPCDERRTRRTLRRPRPGPMAALLHPAGPPSGVSLPRPAASPEGLSALPDVSPPRAQGVLELPLQESSHLHEGDRRYRGRGLSELCRHVWRKNIATDREHAPQLHKRRSQLLQRHAQPCSNPAHLPLPAPQ